MAHTADYMHKHTNIEHTIQISDQKKKQKLSTRIIVHCAFDLVRRKHSPFAISRCEQIAFLLHNHQCLPNIEYCMTLHEFSIRRTHHFSCSERTQQIKTEKNTRRTIEYRVERNNRVGSKDQCCRWAFADVQKSRMHKTHNTMTKSIWLLYSFIRQELNKYRH